MKKSLFTICFQEIKQLVEKQQKKENEIKDFIERLKIKLKIDFDVGSFEINQTQLKIKILCQFQKN